MYSNPPRVLFVEDHQDTLDLFEMMLSQLNYEVVTASNVERALRLAKDERFDIFVLDAWLSDESGIDLCKQIREMDHTTPILFCSARAYEKDKQEALKAVEKIFALTLAQYLVREHPIQSKRASPPHER